MPIGVLSQIKLLNQEEYHALNHRVMRVVFDVQNEFSRFLSEDLAKREIAARCADLGIVPAQREVRIRVRHEHFLKDYFMDLLLANGLMLEAKATDGTAAAHRAQALNYLLLTGMQHGTLVNLRGDRVEHEFISTRLTPERRRHFNVEDGAWKDLTPDDTLLKRKLIELLEDWGAFLEVTLYRDALASYFGGLAAITKPVEISSGSGLIGRQAFQLLTPDTAFSLSAVSDDPHLYGSQLLRFLSDTPLRHVQWINLNHHIIEFRTLTNPNPRPLQKLDEPATA